MPRCSHGICSKDRVSAHDRYRSPVAKGDGFGDFSHLGERKVRINDFRNSWHGASG